MSRQDDAGRGSKSASAIVTDYERLFARGMLPDLVSFVAAAPVLAPSDLAALVHIDQRHRYAVGAILPAETYFESFPALRADEELALDVVYQEYALRREAGEAYPIDKYLERFPELAERLAMRFELDGAIGDDRSPESAPNRSATTVQPALSSEGTILAGRYRLLEEIGQGAWAPSGWHSRLSPCGGEWQ